MTLSRKSLTRGALEPYVWLIHRLLLTIVMLAVVSVLIFCATQALPGDVARIILGKEASEAQLAFVRSQLRLDQPVWSQYLSWLFGVLNGDFGQSLVARVPVFDLVVPRVGNSFLLVLLSMGLAVPVSVCLGLLTASRKDGLTDRLFMGAGVIVNALPEFVLALLLILLLSTNVFHVFPAVSLLSPDTSIWAQLDRLVLPVLTLFLLQTTYLYRLVRGTVIDVLNTEYVQFAALKGMPDRVILFRHVLPNSLVPAIQAAGTMFAYSVGGIVVVEYVFGFPGLGTALADAVGTRDIPVVQAVVLTIAVTFFVVNMMTDLISFWLTPPGRAGR